MLAFISIDSAIDCSPQFASRIHWQGVLAIGVDASGRLTFLNGGEPIIPAADLPNPSYLCVLGRSEGSGARPAALRSGGLCVVSELDEGKFQSFAVSCDGAKINAKAVGEALDTGGSYPCHIISSDVGSDMECIVVCNYGEDEGVLSIFGHGKGDTESAAYTRQASISFGPGSNVDPNRQEKSHAHSTSLIAPLASSSLMDLCCADLGSDAIIQFSMTTSASVAGGISLHCTEQKRLAAPPGSGPRSLTFNPNPVFSNVAIVSLEMTAQVWLIQRVPEDGSYEGLGSPISVLPDGWPDASAKEQQFNKGRWASDAVWSPDGRFVYAAARLHNSISVFEVQLNGDGSAISGLKMVQRVPTNGITPRCLCMSECGNFMLVAHQHSHEITSFARSKSDGTIQLVDRLELPNAACVKLIRPELIG